MVTAKTRRAPDAVIDGNHYTCFGCPLMFLKSSTNTIKFKIALVVVQFNNIVVHLYKV